MRALTNTVTVSINNGPAITPVSFEIEQGFRTETTMLPQPDRYWEYTDKSGHFHAYDVGDLEHYPTLRRQTERVECNGSCGGVCEGEGYLVSRYTCHICREEIKPDVQPGPHTFQVPGLQECRFTVPGFVRDDMVSVRIERDGLSYFGVAVVMNRIVSSDGATSELIVSGRLGRRP